MNQICGCMPFIATQRVLGADQLDAVVDKADVTEVIRRTVVTDDRRC